MDQDGIFDSDIYNQLMAKNGTQDEIKDMLMWMKLVESTYVNAHVYSGVHSC